MSVHISELAERLLFGNTIADKLFHPESVIDIPSPALIGAPEAPGRPIEASWSKERLPFPSDKQFVSPKERGRALLFFANHELLAIELMALCLLRFPNAPPRFRRGLVNTIYEEQSHFMFYQNRATELGVTLADVSVNHFFWDCLSAMQDPFDFVAGMAMTFEQANLDHCLYYQGLFERVGDVDSAAIMARIYTDEIRHLRQGVTWFRHWKDPEQSDFEAHEGSLNLPLSVARAKGRQFDVSGREAAGLSQSYIEQLQVAGISKGRLPNILLFWPNVEAHIASPKQNLPAAAERVGVDLDLLPITNAARGDILLVRNQPSPSHLKQLQQFGFIVPQCVSWDGKKWPVEVVERRIQGVVPWGWDPKIAHLVPQSHNKWASNHRELHSKAWSTELLRKWVKQNPTKWGTAIDDVGIVCESIEEVTDGLNRFSPRPVVIKAELGTAGRQTVRVKNGQLTIKQQQWLKKIFHTQQVIVEPWLDRVLDLSVQLQVDNEGKVVILGWNRFWTTDNGQYCGHWLGPFQKRLPEGLRRWMYGPPGPKGFRNTIFQVAEFVGSALHQNGFSGSAGIDMFIHRTDGKLCFRPIVEVNPRQTMGRIALQASRFCRSREALFLILDSHESNHLIQQFPPQGTGRLEEGVLSLTSTPSKHQAIIAAGAAALHILKNKSLDSYVQSIFVSQGPPKQ